MTDAPERIWATEDTANGTEYVRADLYAALEAQLAKKNADLAEFAHRLGPYWFPSSLET